MAFAPRDVLGGSNAADTRHRRCLHTPALKTACCRVLMTMSSTAYFGAQRMRQAVPPVAFARHAKVVINALPLWKVCGPHAPLNTADHNIQNGIDDVAHLSLARASTVFGFGQQLFDMLPLAISQITGIVFVRLNLNIPN